MKKTIKNFKEKINLYARTNIIFFVFVIATVVNGWILRYFTVGNVFDIWPLLADLAIVLIIASFAYFFRPKKQYKYYLTWSIVFSLICMVNSMYYTTYTSFSSISLMATTSQVIGVADAVVFDVMNIKDFVFFWQIFAIVFVHNNLNKRNYYKVVLKTENGKIRMLSTFVFAFILLGFFASSLSGVDVSRLGKQWNREFIVIRYGIYIYHLNDVVSSLRPKFNNLFGYDEAYRLFRKHFENEKLLEKNEYTNIFENKNLIMIHAESFQTFVTDLEFNGEELTPNVNRLASEGLFFRNFYAQDAVGTSSDTEFTLNTSLMPVNSGTVFVNYWDREYISIPKLLKEKGYYSFSMHGNNGSFWNRNVMYPALGYDYFYYYDKDFVLDEKIQLGLSDKSFFRQAIPYIEEIHQTKENFYGTLITLTNHTPFLDVVEQGIVDFNFSMAYTYYDEELAEEVEAFAPYVNGHRIGNYLTSIRYADEAIGLFIELLEEIDVLEDTVIVIYGDHDAKLRKEDYDQLYNYDPHTNSILDVEDENYQSFDFYERELKKSVPLIIWSKNKKLEKEVKMVMGMYDVMPTLGNMFGFHNPYALGNDMFSVEKNVVVFPSGNWVTNDIYYNAQKNEGKVFEQDGYINIEEVEYYQSYVDELLTVSRGIIVHNLFSKLAENEEKIERDGRE